MKTANYYFLVIDIETSKFEKIENGKLMPQAVWLSFGYINLYHIKDGKIKSTFFREWKELDFILQSYSNFFLAHKIICYVHNLSHEFDFFIKNLSLPIKLLSNTTHKVICSTLKSYPNIEFRCTYQISGMSLRKLGDILGYEKYESEYPTITPLDDIPQDYKTYCDRDCDVVAKYVTEILLKNYKTLSDIPYTKTGMVRKVFKQNYHKYCSKNEVWDKMPPNNCYKALNDSFQGGLTFSNPIFTGRELSNVSSYDETSAYPYVMLKNKYPFTIRKEENTTLFNTSPPFWIAKIKFYNISSKYNWGILSRSKMNDYDLKSSQFYNGKLLTSNFIERTMTNIDFEILNLCYNYDEYQITEFYPCDKYDYLPKPYIETITTFIQDKHDLKIQLHEAQETATKEELKDLSIKYTISKNKLNSIYGMCVEKLMHNEFEIDDNYMWTLKEQEYVCDEKAHLKRNFLIGIYVTAYSRLNLIKSIITNCPENFVYADTDSVKFINITPFKNTNEHLQYPFSENESTKDLGIFDYEGTYEKFCTFGAKKYAFIKNGKSGVVVAGLPVSDNIKYSNFINGIGHEFKDCKNAHRYIINNISFSTDDYDEICEVKTLDTDAQEYLKSHKIVSNGGIAIYRTSYKLDVTHEDKLYLELIQKGILLWLKSYNKKSGIDLTKYCSTELLIK